MIDSEKDYVNGDGASLSFKGEKTVEDLRTARAADPGMNGTKKGVRNKKRSSTTGGAGSDDNTEKHLYEDSNTCGSDVTTKSNFSGSLSLPYSTRKPNQSDAKYLARLLEEKAELEALPNIFQFTHVIRLVNDAINKLREDIGELPETSRGPGKKANQKNRQANNDGSSKKMPVAAISGKKVLLQEKIFIPVKEFPNYNFVGRILGPRGMTAKQLEEESGCRIMIRGRGSIREDGPHRQNANGDSSKEELHILVQCEDFEDIAKEKLRRAVQCIRFMLIPPPDGEDELKRKQLMELSIINGTYRPNAARMAYHGRLMNYGNIGAYDRMHDVNGIPRIANSVMQVASMGKKSMKLQMIKFKIWFDLNCHCINRFPPYDQRV